MNHRESEGNPEEPAAELSQIATEYYELINKPTFSLREDFERCDELHDQLISFRSKLALEEYSRILLSAITKAKGMPKSQNISNEAIARIEESRKKYILEFADNFSKENLTEELREHYDTWVGDQAGRYLLAKVDGQVIGFSVLEIIDYGVIEVSFQAGAKNFPGVGLLMLQEILHHFQEDETIYKVELATARRPYGLGNLGFSMAKEQDPMCVEDNQLSFENTLKEKTI